MGEDNDTLWLRMRYSAKRRRWSGVVGGSTADDGLGARPGVTTGGREGAMGVVGRGATGGWTDEEGPAAGGGDDSSESESSGRPCMATVVAFPFRILVFLGGITKLK